MKLAKYFSLFSNIFCDGRPNVIILIADDFGVGDFRVNQAKGKVPTPNIDRLGSEGVNFKVKFDEFQRNHKKNFEMTKWPFLAEKK